MKRVSLWKGKRDRGVDLGQILVEAAIALPVFFLLVFGTLEVGKIIFRRLQLSYAAFTVTRTAVVNDGQYIPEALRRISPRLDTQYVSVHPIYDPANDYYWVTLEYKGPGTYRTVRLVPEHTFPLFEAAGIRMGSSRNRHDPLTYRGKTSYPGYSGGNVSAVEYEMSRPIGLFVAWETEGQKTGLAGNGVVRRWRPPDNRLIRFRSGIGQSGWGPSYAWKVNTMVATGWNTPQRNPEWGWGQRMAGVVTSPFYSGHLLGNKGLQGNPEFIAVLFPLLTGSAVIQDYLNMIALGGLGGWNRYAEYPLARGSMGAAYGKGREYGGYVWMYTWFGKPPVVIKRSWSPDPWIYQSYAYHQGNAGWDGFMQLSGVGGSVCVAPTPKGCALWDNDQPGAIGGTGWSGQSWSGGGSQEWNFYWAAYYTAQQVELVNNVAVHPYTKNIGNSWSDYIYVFDQGWGSGDPWAPGQGEWETFTGCLDGPCRSNPIVSFMGISNYDAHVNNRILDEKSHGFHWSYREPRNDHTDPSPGWSH